MVDVGELRRLSDLLDQALDLPPPEREAWLATLGGEAAALVPTLRELLARAASHETVQLLDRGPAFMPPGEADAAPAWHAGDAVGPYRLLRPIGQGGMGEVWLAERSDGQLRRSVALKLPMLGLRRSVLVQRFARERDILGGLAHPHIARLYDAGLAEDGQPYLALEYVDGQPITAYCDAHGLNARARVQLLLQVMEAVQYAHANLVIHRDLKPSNVLVTAQGQAMLLDFGIAKLLQGEQTEAQETELTQQGGRPLTLDYAAPEQLGGAPISIATDVWALGVLLHELLTGQRPFRGTRHDVEHAILHTDPARPKELPADLVTVMLKALKKAPVERYGTVAAFADDIQRWRQGLPVSVQPDSIWYRTRRFVARNGLAVSVSAAAVVTLMMTTAAAVQQAREARAQSLVAQSEAATAQAVEQFLQGIFLANRTNQPDPIAARQRTAKELLDEGASRIDSALATAPQAKARALNTLAEIYGGMGEIDTAVRLFAQAAELAARTDGPHSPARLRALAMRAANLAVAMRVEEAQKALDELAAVPPAAWTPENRAILLQATAGLGVRSAEPGRALAPAQELVSLLRQQPPGPALIEALEMLGTAFVRSGRATEAISPLSEAVQRATQKETFAPAVLADAQLELGMAHFRLGHHEQAETHLRAGLEEAVRRHGDRTLTYMFALGNLAVVLQAQDRWREAADLIDRALAVLQLQADSPDRKALTYMVAVSAARLDVWLGRLDQARARLAAAAATGQRGKLGPEPDINYDLVDASQALEAGSDAQATAALARARKAASAAGGRVAAYLRDVETDQAWLDWRMGRGDAMIETVRRLRGTPVDSGTAGQSASDVAIQNCLEALTHGDKASLSAACDAVFDAPTRPAGVVLPALSAARLGTMVAHRMVELGDPAKARIWAEVAVKVLDRAADPRTSTLLIDPLLSLAEVARVNGDAAAALAALKRAREIAKAQPQLSQHYRQRAT